MKLVKLVILLVLLITLSSCGRLASYSTRPMSESVAEPKYQYKTTTQVSLQQAGQSQSIAEAANRKILRNGELTLEVPSPENAELQITSIADAAGGFVVTSESKQHDIGDPPKQYLEVNLVIRVPEAQFQSTFDQILGLGARVIQNKKTGEDVTEEFIDLEARIKTQKALELQFLEIMKSANKVPDALEVQRQIAEVRTEIEKLEGRKRFLENRASLSTITVSLQSPGAITVSTSGFRRNVRDALGDGVDLTVAIVLFLIRFIIVMIPIFFLLLLPLGLIARYLWRRTQRLRSSRGRQSDLPPRVPPDKPMDSQPT